MKKFLIPILCIAMSVVCFANSENDLNVDENITVKFNENSQFTEEEKTVIAERLVYGYTEDGSSTYGWCWLTGHDITTEAVSVVEHKVDTVAPRCFETVYEIETCSNCDYYTQEELTHSYIYCCPEE